MKTGSLLLLIALLSSPLGAPAQNDPAPQPVPESPPSPARPALPPQAFPERPAPSPQTAPAAAPARELGAKEGVLLNFKDAPIASVLEYLSEAAGFVILMETDVSGTVTVMSRQPLDREEVVDLLNTILYTKGYAAIQNGRTLAIVNRDDARTKNIPVIRGSDPMEIPRKDQMVTQILPVSYANAQELVQVLEPLMPESTTISASQTSNALVITDTQNNIRRMAEIVRALDTSISEVSSIRVYQLRNANATEVAEVINQVFSGQASASGGRDSRGGGGDAGDRIREMMRSRFGGGGPPGGGGGGPPGGGGGRD